MTIKCSFCGKEFHRKLSEIHKTNFCNMKCYGNYKKEFCKGKNNNFYGRHHSKKTIKIIRKKELESKRGHE